MRCMHVWLSNRTPSASRAKHHVALQQAARRRYREAVTELSKLSDHELSDIGISRGDIEYVARRPVVSKASA